jgi:hypothetical protein
MSAEEYAKTETNMKHGAGFRSHEIELMVATAARTSNLTRLALLFHIRKAQISVARSAVMNKAVLSLSRQKLE